MKFFKKAIVAVAAVASIGALMPAAPAQAVPRAVVGGGSGIIVGPNALCTMTTVGRDRAGRLVGLTAAHCGNLGALIRSERYRNAGVIGQIVTRNANLDVAVISLFPSRVTPVRKIGAARITRVGTYPRPFTNVCKSGRTTGYTCGPTLQFQGREVLNYVCANHGDSGGPVISNGRVVGMLNGATRIAGAGTPSIPCINPAFPVYTPMVATKMTTIVGSLNRLNVTGSGFRPI